MTPAQQNQKDFTDKYITSGEICSALMVSRTALHHRRKSNKLPEPISVNNNTVTIWVRAEVRTALEEWSNDMYGRVVEGI